MNEDIKKILELPLAPDCIVASNIRGYLGELLYKVWVEGESFNGKRPFGDSGWQFDLYWPLARAGLIDCTVDADQDIVDLDYRAGDKIITRCIIHLLAP